MSGYVANLEMHFNDVAPDVVSRIRAAAAAGFRDLDFWRWQDLDIDLVEKAVKRTDARIHSFVIDWSIPITKPENHARYRKSWEQSLRLAERLGTTNLISLNGAWQPQYSQAQQSEIVAGALDPIAAQAASAGVTVLIEPLNTVIDHAGTWLNSTAKAVELIDQVGSPNLKILFDIYHAATEGEDLTASLDMAEGRVGYIHAAGMPGRTEPASGGVDWISLRQTLERIGFTGRLGLEYTPTMPSYESLRVAAKLLTKHGLRPDWSPGGAHGRA